MVLLHAKKYDQISESGLQLGFAGCQFKDLRQNPTLTQKQSGGNSL